MSTWIDRLDRHDSEIEIIKNQIAEINKRLNGKSKPSREGYYQYVTMKWILSELNVVGDKIVADHARGWIPWYCKTRNIPTPEKESGRYERYDIRAAKAFIAHYQKAGGS